MKVLSELPLGRKLVLTMMATSSAALLIACLSFLSYDVLTFRRGAADHLNSLSDITGANVAAALTYHDPKSANLVLQALQAEPHIVAARVYDIEGNSFASYLRNSTLPGEYLPAHPPRAGSHLEPGRIINCQPILFDEETVGFVYLESDLRELQVRKRRLASFVLILMATSSAMAFLVALILKRFISRPVLDLVKTTKQVSRERTYGIRARKYARDELGLLVDGFNEMLEEIEKRDAGLKKEVADRIRIEQVLRESEAQLQLLLDSTAEAIYGIDGEGRCRFVNRTCLLVLGYRKPEDLLGRKMHDLIHHSHRDGSPYPAEECPGQRTITRGTASHLFNEYLWRADGSSFPVEIWSYPVWRGDSLVGGVITFVDITERERAEAALRAAHKESELFINSVPSILIGIDASGKIARWNLAAATTFGLPETSVLGKSLLNCGIKWLEPHLEAEVACWFGIERPERRDNLMFEKDGLKRFLGVTIKRVEFPNAKSAGLLITGADVTERKSLEMQLGQAQKLEAIGRLAAGVAHEINTPTQYIGDNARFLKKTWPAINDVLEACYAIWGQSGTGTIGADMLARLLQSAEEARLDYVLRESPRAIDGCLEGVQRVSNIVTAMKEFSHPRSQEKVAIDINRAIETTIAVARNEWKYVADVRTCFDPTLPPVPGLGGEFNQVILNLLINAAHAIGDVVGDGSMIKGKITIITKRDKDWAEIRIQDTGAGIPKDIRSRIFEPFFTTKEVGKGTGQGLALAHAMIVKKHNGKIWFESEEGMGTTFFVRLPLQPARPSEKTAPSLVEEPT
ncbi:MAG TPA: PAS domain S-box protein [Methylomirabilota bacterium]|nr:PAS domain S-box protein [Methylomirabilota bacterium]